MHDAAFAFYKDNLHSLDPMDVLEFGSYNINGSVRDAYVNSASWHGIDVVPGNGVDEVGDASIWKSDKRYDIVICAEAFEHTPEWKKIIENAKEHLNTGGLFLASCASRSRPPHSAVDGGALQDGEYYKNISPEEMTEYLEGMNWSSFEVIPADGYFGDDDLYIKAVK